MPRGFTFRLETVLRVRREAFEERQRVVAARLRALQVEQRRAADLHGRIAEALNESRLAQSAGAVDLQQVRGLRVFVFSLRQQLERVNLAIKGQEEHLKKERGALIEASVALKAIEKLKERRFERYRQDQQRRETTEADELAIQGFLRRRRAANQSALSA